MAQRILVFGDHASSLEICRHLRNDFELDQVDRDAGLGARLAQSRVDLLIAAMDCPVAANELIRILRETPAGARNPFDTSHCSTSATNPRAWTRRGSSWG